MGHGLTFADSPKIEPAIATRLRNIFAGVGAAGILASAALLFLGDYGGHGAKIFYFSYLTAYFACVTIHWAACFTSLFITLREPHGVQGFDGLLKTSPVSCLGQSLDLSPWRWAPMTSSTGHTLKPWR